MKVVLKNSSLVFQTVAPPQTFHYSKEVTQGIAANIVFPDFATTTNGQYFKIIINDSDDCLDASSGNSLAAGSTFVASVKPNIEATVEVNSSERISSSWSVYVAANNVLKSGTVTVDIELYG